MRKSSVIAVAVGLAAILVAGGLIASNMGFKLNFLLEPPGGSSLTGTTLMAVPYNPQTNLINAEDLIQDINAVAGTTAVQAVGRFNKATNGQVQYTGASGTNFPLDGAEGFYVTVGSTVNYIIVGSHDPSRAVTFYAPGAATPDGVSLTGSNTFSWPYHSTLTNADEMLQEINAVGGGSVASVAQFNKATNGLVQYNGASGTNFGLAPGQAYIVTLNAGGNITGYVPSHY